MIERYGWDALPEPVRGVIRQHLGQPTVLREVEHGQNCNLALVVKNDRGTAFLKGVRGVSPRMRWLRNEATAGELATGLAPATRFCEDVDPDWLVVGFEYLSGRPAVLAPDSADLPLIAETVTRISEFDGGTAQPLSARWAAADWWTKLAEVASEDVVGWDLDEVTEWSRRAARLVSGSTLLHTDLHEHQFMIDDKTGRVRVIDWGRPASGAAWVDVALLVIRLIAAGHRPAEAEQWATAVPSWKTATKEALTAFACYVAGLWTYRGVTSPFTGSTELSFAAKDYAAHRLTSWNVRPRRV
ncbi:phosphotransferase [Amycolatopsis sp. NPDC050768]|uniref:phosphotransferase family protein n=1 Tax=Amycolatopsis sp. NPDC050768 TaxID=3154839 RepID=UPI0033E9A817